MIVGAAWVSVALCSLFVFPVASIPASVNSWDVLHSGRRFAEQGFAASRLQPRWMPFNDSAPYLTYTHYPPLPYWISGVVQTGVSEPQARIRAMMHLIRLVGITALLCGYLLLRQFSVAPAAAALTIGALAWSQHWWGWVSGEMTWCSWFTLFLFGTVAAFVWGLRQERTGWRIGFVAGTACCVGAALCAFDAWLWTATFFAVLLCLAPRRAAGIRRRLLSGLVVACAATALAIGTRVGVNWWYFGSMAAVVQDLGEAYQVRSAFTLSADPTRENKVNYFEAPARSPLSRWGWISEYFRTLPENLVRTYLPPRPYNWWIAVVAIALAPPAWWAVLVGRRKPASLAWPTPITGLIAVAAAPIPFVLAVPAISVQQLWCILSLAPAMLLSMGLVCDAATATLVGGLSRVHERGEAMVTALAAVAALTLLTTRLSTPRGYEWMVPLEESRAAVQAIADLNGVVFVNVPDTNPLMFLLPLESRVALKPLLVQRTAFFKDVRPVRVLFDQSLGGIPADALAAAQTEQRSGLPNGWSLVTLPQSN